MSECTLRQWPFTAFLLDVAQRFIVRNFLQLGHVALVLLLEEGSMELPIWLTTSHDVVNVLTGQALDLD